MTTISAVARATTTNGAVRATTSRPDDGAGRTASASRGVDAARGGAAAQAADGVQSTRERDPGREARARDAGGQDSLPPPVQDQRKSTPGGKQEAAAKDRQLERWKDVGRDELAASVKDGVDEVKQLSRDATKAVSGDNLDFDAYRVAAQGALDAFAEAQASISSWREANPQASDPEALRRELEQARAAIRDIPKFDSLVGTDDGSTMWIGGVSWPDWAVD
jgi:hypothetical protein